MRRKRRRQKASTRRPPRRPARRNTCRWNRSRSTCSRARAGGDQYLQLAFTLEVGGLEEKENIKSNMAKVRSRMLLLLSGKHAADINTPEGKVQLAKEIIAS